MKYQGRITDPKDLVTKEYVDDGLSGKQATLTFDSTPTQNSTNPVTSGGLYDEINPLKSAIIDTASIDNAGLISYKHGSTVKFTLQLPLYAGGVT